MKTKCCYTNHYTLNENSILCTNKECVNYLSGTALIKQNRLKRFLTGGWLFLFLVAFTSHDFSNINSDAIIKQQKELTKRMSVSLTRESLRNELDEVHILCPDETMAQMLLESGNLSSFLLGKTNNMLGMRYPFRRNTTATGIYLPSKDTIIYGASASLKKYSSQNNYAVYACWQDAVKDYKLWQDEYFRLTERYLHFLGNVYAEDAGYENKIRSVMVTSSK